MHKDTHSHEPDKELKHIGDALYCICKELHFFNQHLFAAQDFGLKSVIQGDSMAISPTPIGGSSKYRLSLVPANAVALSSGPTANSGNPLVTVTQDASDPFLLTSTADASVTDASYTVTATGVNGVGTTITHTFTVPLSAAPPPQAVDFDLNDA